MQTQNSVPAPTQSALADYMANYGAHLQSLLANPLDTGAAGVSPMGQPAGQGGSALPSAAPSGPQAAPAAPLTALPGGPTQDPAVAPNPQRGLSVGHDGSDFRKRWRETSPEQQKQFANKLDDSLKQGNQTIDSAYDQLVKQLGAPPADDHKLTREEKGMLLMEFGLNLMANSSDRAYGNDLGGAIGAAGSSALQGHLARRGHDRDVYEERRFGIEKERAGAKARLAEQSALESRAEARDDRRREREDSQLAGVMYGPDDTLYGYTRGGQVSALEQPGGGGTVKGRKPPARGGAGASGGGRVLESDRRYQLYMDTYGKDAAGNPLTGDQLNQVKRKALAFSADPKAATLSDAEMRGMAERSADAFMKSNWTLFRDMTPDQAQNWRNKTADANYKRLRDGRDIELAPPAAAAPAGGSKLGSPPLTRGRSPRAAKASYASQADVEAAYARKEIQNGDTVMVNGKPFTVQVQ